MSYSIRRLAANDSAQMNRLNAVFANAFEDAESYVGADHTYLKERLGDPSCIVLAAFDENEEIIGGIVAYELKKLEQARSEIYLYDLAVHIEHRRKGVATALIEELRSVARAIGAYVIFVQADNIDHGAIALYRTFASEEITPHHFDILP